MNVLNNCTCEVNVNGSEGFEELCKALACQAIANQANSDAIKILANNFKKLHVTGFSISDIKPSNLFEKCEDENEDKDEDENEDEDGNENE